MTNPIINLFCHGTPWAARVSKIVSETVCACLCQSILFISVSGSVLLSLLRRSMATKACHQWPCCAGTKQRLVQPKKTDTLTKDPAESSLRIEQQIRFAAVAMPQCFV